MQVAFGKSLPVPVGPDRSIRSRLAVFLFHAKNNRLSARVLEVALGECRLWWRDRVMVYPRVATGREGRQCVVILMNGVPVTEISVAEAPASNSVVPRLVATSDVVVGQLFHRFERIEATPIDR